MESSNKSKVVLNDILVKLFNNILEIEQNALKQGPLNDLSITEIHTIEAIGMYESKIMTEVANDLGITTGTLTTAINKLVKKEYVERSRGEEDRRAVKIALTKKGKLAYRIHEKFHHDMVEEIMCDLTQEKEEVLIEALSKLNIYFSEKCTKHK